MSEEKCENCFKREKRTVNKLKLEFANEMVTDVMSEVLPLDDNTSGIFCVWPGCDSNYKLILDQTFQLPNKRTYNEAFKPNPNGVPNYYYQKPPNKKDNKPENFKGNNNFNANKRKKYDT